MKKTVPFYTNTYDGNQCLQICVQTAIKYYTGKTILLKDLDQLTGRKPDLWTWTPQIIPTLLQFGLHVKYYSKTDLIPYKQGEAFIRENFKEQAENILLHTDISSLVSSIDTVIKSNVFEHKIVTESELELALENDQIVCMMIDWNVLEQLDKPYAGHMVVVTQMNKDSVHYHESGPELCQENRIVTKEKFLSAWNALGTDNDVLIISSADTSSNLP